MLHTGQPGEGKRKIWMISRQHPGETMAEWFVEGFLRRLLDTHDGLAKRLLREAVFYVVRSGTKLLTRACLTQES